MFRSVTARIAALGAIVAAAASGIALLSAISSAELERSVAWVSHTQQVLKLITDPIDHLRGAESDLRAMVITGDTSIGSDIHRDLAGMRVDLDRLVALTADNPPQNQRARALRAAALHRAQFIADGLARAYQGQSPDEQKARTIQARAMMRDVELRQQDMQAAEQILWAQRTQRAADLVARNRRDVMVGGFTVGSLVLLMVALIIRAIRRPSGRLMEAMEALNVGNINARLDAAAMGASEFTRLARGFNAMADRLELAVASQQRSEDELQGANRRLQEHSAALEERSAIIERLGAMAHRMQAARTDAEFAQVIGCFVPRVLSRLSGAIYAHNNSRNQLVRIATWGSPHDCPDHFGPDECWALRLGQSHRVAEHGEDIVCAHVGDARAVYHCEPLLAGGEVIGLIHLEGPVSAESRFRLSALAEDVASALVNHRLQRNLREQTIRDPLTGLFNRRYLEETLQVEIARAARAKSPLTLVMCDVDHFKRFNDDFGHEAGDHVLQAVTAEMRNHFREGDVVCRFGGEEFTVIAPGATPEAMAPRIERLRKAIAELQLRLGSTSLGSVSMSFGLARLTDEMLRDGSTLLQTADEALYRAKREGRNRAILADQIAA